MNYAYFWLYAIIPFVVLAHLLGRYVNDGVEAAGQRKMYAPLWAERLYTGTSRFAIRPHSSRADEHIFPALLHDFPDHRHGIGHRHSNFDAPNAAGADRLHRAVRFLDRGRAHHRNNPNLPDPADYIVDAQFTDSHKFSAQF